MDDASVLGHPLTRPAHAQSGSGLIIPTPQGDQARTSFRVRELEREILRGRERRSFGDGTAVFAGWPATIAAGTRSTFGVAHRDTVMRYLWVGLDEGPTSGTTTVDWYLDGVLEESLSISSAAGDDALDVAYGLNAFQSRWYFEVSAIGAGSGYLTCVAVYE